MRLVAALLSALWFCVGFPGPVTAFEIVLKDVAPDRIERQRAEARGQVPLPGTPDIGRFAERLAEKGLKLGNHVFLRIFKEESELEVWMAKGDAYVHFATYPICFWSGSLGPKLAEGDKQTPEGFYTVTRRQLHLIGRWPRSLNLGFPNVYDRSHRRTGSYILIHGGCSSVGCYAMTDDVRRELYDLVARAIRRGRQRWVHVHAFPFRMTDENMDRHRGSEWADFWANLKQGYDLFEETRVPPQVGVCDGRYAFARATVARARRMALRTMRKIAYRPGLEDVDDDRLVCFEPPPADVKSEDLEREAAVMPEPSRRIR